MTKRPDREYQTITPIVLTFAWPADTSLNARLHWAKRAKMVKANVAEGYYAAKAASNTLPPGQYRATFTFHPPTRRHYDDDNLLARVKGHRDGFCKALGLDDHCIHAVIEIGEVSKPGRVVVTVTRLEGE